MRPANQVDIVLLAEGRDYFLSKSERHSTVILSPSLYIFVGIRPKKITKKSGIRNIGGSHDSLDLVERAEFWAESSVHAEDFLVDQGCDWQAVEAVGEGLPEFDVVSAFALVVEPVDSVDGSALVVSSQQEEVLGVFYFVRQQQAHSLQ